MERLEVGQILQELYNDAVKAPKIFKPQELEALQLAAWEFDPHCIGCYFYRSDGFIKRRGKQVEVFKCRNQKSKNYWRYTGWREVCDEWKRKEYEAKDTS